MVSSLDIADTAEFKTLQAFSLSTMPIMFLDSRNVLPRRLKSDMTDLRGVEGAEGVELDGSAELNDISGTVIEFFFAHLIADSSIIEFCFKCCFCNC
jgi:hypothetical protein